MLRLSRRTFLGASTSVALLGCGLQTAPVLSRRGFLPPNKSLPDGGMSPDGDGDGGAPPIDLAAIPERQADYPLGIMAGDSTASVAMVWTRYAGNGPFYLVVVEMDVDRGVATIFDQTVAPGSDGFTHVDVPNLTPGARYQYAFVSREGGALISRSPIGRFRAALAADALEVVTFGGTSCTHQEDRPHPTLSVAGNRADLDFFLHAGDHVYTDAVSNATTLAEYRAKYKDGWTSPGMMALHRSAGLYLTWDDHEVDNNFNPETISRTRLGYARQAFFEHRALRRSPDAPDRIWRSFRWGRTVEVFVLDCRGERKPSTRGQEDAQYISPEQLAWLKTGLKNSPAMFKVIVNSVPIIDFPGAPPAGGDTWESYAAQRKDLLDDIVRNDITGVWWASGDHHYGAIGKLAASGPDAAMREVLMGPGGTPAKTDISLPSSQFDCVLPGEKNFVVWKADPFAREMTVTFVGSAGQELFSRRYPL